MKTLLFALSFCAIFASPLAAQSATTLQRRVQIVNVDFTTGIVEVRNLGNTTQSLTGWVFNSQNATQDRRFTAETGLNNVNLAANQSLFIYFNNNSPGGNLRRNLSSLGGNSLATPLSPNGYVLQLFINSNFNNQNALVDHLQWNISGARIGLFDQKAAQARTELLWPGASSYISTTSLSQSINLTDLSGDINSTPTDFQVTEPAVAFPETLAINDIEVTSAGAVDLSWEDLSAFGSIDYAVEMTDDLADPDSWQPISGSPFQTTSTTINGLSAGPLFFRVVASPAS